MVNKSHQLLRPSKGAQRPAACLSRNDQMSARRNFEIRKPKNFALQANTVVQFIDCSAFADYDFLIIDSGIRMHVKWKQ